MEDYDLRSCFLPDLSGLHLRIFQFQRLLHQHMPKLAAHLDDLQIERREVAREDALHRDRGAARRVADEVRQARLVERLGTCFHVFTGPRHVGSDYAALLRAMARTTCLQRRAVPVFRYHVPEN